MRQLNASARPQTAGGMSGIPALGGGTSQSFAQSLYAEFLRSSYQDERYGGGSSQRYEWTLIHSSCRLVTDWGAEMHVDWGAQLNN